MGNKKQMKIAIDEDIIREFIGADLEVISGKEPFLNNDKAFTNFPKKDGHPPQTSDDFGKEARLPWWAGYWGAGVNGAMGMSTTGTIFENQDQQVATNTLEDVKTLYGDESLYSMTLNIITEISHLDNDLPDTKDIKMVQFLVLAAILEAIDFDSMDESLRNKLRAKI